MAAVRELDNDDKKVTLAECNDAITSWYDVSSEHIERGRNYLTFLYVDQWDLNVKSAREAVGKPCMQFNKVTTMVRSVLGEQRLNSPTLTVRGVGSKATQQDVDVRDGLLRQIQYESDADIAYQVARKHAMEVGWGGGRVIAEYIPGTFLQRLRVIPIMDFQAGFWDD
ncbi:MAG: portal protein, partial [Gammaproteobacteria bacterium]